jgi:hypothetical protein
VLADEGRLAEAADWYRRATVVFAAKADRFGCGRAQFGLGELALAKGNAADATELFRDSLDQFTACGVTVWADRARQRLRSATPVTESGGAAAADDAGGMRR